MAFQAVWKMYPYLWSLLMLRVAWVPELPAVWPVGRRYMCGAQRSAKSRLSHIPGTRGAAIPPPPRPSVSGPDRFCFSRSPFPWPPSTNACHTSLSSSLSFLQHQGYRLFNNLQHLASKLQGDIIVAIATRLFLARISRTCCFSSLWSAHTARVSEYRPTSLPELLLHLLRPVHEGRAAQRKAFCPCHSDPIPNRTPS